MKSIVDLAEHHFGNTINDRILKQLRQNWAVRDEDAVEDFMTALEEFTLAPYVPERVDGELRAFVGYTHSDADMIFYDVDSNSIDMNYFKRLLLYYNRVALTIHTEFFYERRWDRDAALGLLDLVNSIKPLVEQNIINFVAEPVLYTLDSGFDHAFQELTGREGPKREEEELFSDLNACHVMDFDYVTTSLANWSAIESWHVDDPTNQMEKEARHVWATSLLRVELPNLADLTYADIVSIRKNSHAFMEWRKTLEELFELLAKNNPSTVEQLHKEIQYFSKHRVGEKKRLLEEEIGKSSLKVHLTDSALVITVSFLGALIANRYLPIPLECLLITLLTGPRGVASLAPLIAQGGRRRQQKLLAKYYSLLEGAS